MTSKEIISKKDIIIIIPAKNEFNNLKKLFNSLKKFKIDSLIINDNSNDQTYLIKKKFPKIKIIENKISNGYDKSVKIGLKFAKTKYKFAITMDADYEHDPKYIPLFIKSLKKYDLVIANRDRKNRFLEKLFGLFFKKIYGINDIFCGYRGIKLENLKSSFLKEDFNMPSVIINFHKHTKNSENINIKTKSRVGSSRFGNIITGNLKIFFQFINIFT